MPTAIDKFEEARLREELARQRMLSGVDAVIADQRVFNKNMSLYYSMHPQGIQQDLTPFKSEDFGNSRFDKRARSLQDYSDPTDLRAAEQSTLGKWGNALVKTAVTTGTTFANMFNTAFVAPFVSMSPEYDRVNNPITAGLMQIEDWAEKVFPNYRSHAEQEAKWYQRLGTANFWADDIMKNIGFSMGSVGAAKLATKGLSSVVRQFTKGAYRKGFEALGKQFGKDMAAKEIRNVLKNISKDAAQEIGKRETLHKLARISKFEDAFAGVTGSVLGAVGEAQYEAQNAYTDFVEENKQRLDDWYKDNDAYIRQMYAEAQGLDEEGNPIDYETFKNLKYEKAVNDIETEGLKVGNTVFAYESALLSATNYATFRRFFGGGFKNFNPVSTTSRIPGVARDEVSKKIGTRVLEDGTIEAYRKGSKLGNFTPIIKNAVTEGPIEEMGQNFINKSSEYYHGSYLNEKLNFLLNDRYNADAASAINAMQVGFARSYGDSDQWMDGFAGAIFGLAGVPGVQRNSKYTPKPKTGEDTRSKEERRRFDIKAIPFYNAEGSVRSEWKEIQDRNKLADETVLKVNEIIKSPEKRKQFEDYILTLAHNDKMNEALQKGDKLQYKDSEFEELMTVVSAFSNAGMDDVLDEMIDSIANNLNDESIAKVMELLSDEEKKKTNEQIRERIAKEVRDTKELVSSYRQTRDDLAVLHGRNFTQNQLDTLSEMLALANYKNARGLDILKEYPELFPDGATDVTQALSEVGKLLKLDDEKFNNIDKLPKETAEKIKLEHIASIMASMPGNWDPLKKEKAFRDIEDSLKNFVEAIQLNNEFGELVARPPLMNAVFARLYDDHLNEREKEIVSDITNKLKNAKSKDEAKSIVDSLKDDKIGNTIRLRLDVINNPFVNEYLSDKRKEKMHNNIVGAIRAVPNELAELYKVDVDYVNGIADIVANEKYDNVQNKLVELHDAETDQGKKEFLSHILSQYHQIEETTAAAAPRSDKVEDEEGLTDEEKAKFAERKEKMDVFLNDDNFTKIIADAWKGSGGAYKKTQFIKDGRLSSIAIGQANGKSIMFSLINDLYYGQTYIEIKVKGGGTVEVGIGDFVYNKDKDYSTEKYIEEVKDALEQLFPDIKEEDARYTAERFFNKMWYFPLNGEVASKIEHSEYADFLVLNDINTVKKPENAPEPVQINDYNNKKANEIIQRIKSKYDVIEAKTNEVINLIDNMKREDKAKYNNLFSLRYSADLVIGTIKKIREIIKNIEDKAKNGFSTNDIKILSETEQIVNSIKPIVLPKTQSAVVDNTKEQSLVITKTIEERDDPYQLVSPWTEYDLPPKSLPGNFEQGTMSRYNVVSNTNARKAFVDGEEHNIDLEAMTLLYDEGNDARKALFYLKEGDVVSFEPLNEDERKVFLLYYGDKYMPFAAVHNGERVGYVVPDGRSTLWNAIKKDPNTTAKVKEKFAYNARVESYPKDNDVEQRRVSDLGKDIGILAFIDGKGSLHLSEGDVENYKTRYGLTNDDINVLREEIKNQNVSPGKPFVIMDIGDHFKPHTAQGRQRVNMTVDNVIIKPTYQVITDELAFSISSKFEDIFNNGITNEAVNTANKLLRLLFATGKNKWSYLNITKRQDTGDYWLTASMNFARNPENNYVIDLFKVDNMFVSNLMEMLVNESVQNSYNINGNIVFSINDTTMSRSGAGEILSSSNIRDVLLTERPSYIPYNVNATYDIDVQNTPQAKQQEDGTPPIGSEDVEKSVTPTYTGKNNTKLNDFIEDIKNKREQLMTIGEIQELVNTVMSTADGSNPAENYESFVQRVNTLKNNPSSKQGFKKLSNAVTGTITQTTGNVTKLIIDKNVYKYLFADTNNTALMENLKDC